MEAFQACGPARGADVSWRHVLQQAGPGYFLAGDAGAVLDPASSNGVIRALMTGIGAVRHLLKIAGDGSEKREIAEYSRWTLDWHKRDQERLSQLYSVAFNFSMTSPHFRSHATMPEHRASSSEQARSCSGHATVATTATVSAAASAKRVGGQSPGESGSHSENDHALAQHWTYSYGGLGWFGVIRDRRSLAGISSIFPKD
jgi:flavin-dependent dehydrogenase